MIEIVECTLGAFPLEGGRCRFSVWAPEARRVDVCLTGGEERTAPMKEDGRGRFQVEMEGVEPGSLYRYRLDGDRQLPDPASRCQPQGVHGPSQVTDGRCEWTDLNWRGIPLADYIFYEIHTGLYTPEGTFEAIIPRLPALKELGVTALELMPVAQFPGERNWGYDGVGLFAAHISYGGPRGLKKLVDACHREELAVVLDVVYNHLGPEGNYLAEFGPYFTDRYKTPWGPAVNFDGAGSDEVRRFFIENALYWVTECHVDALRLDAIHAIFDRSAISFLEQLGEAVHYQGRRLNRRIHVIPESALNDSRVIRPRETGGFGLDAQWNDDFHHALRTMLTNDRAGYYQDFGGLDHLAKAFREGYVYTGEYSAYRRRSHGNPARSVPGERFVVFAQNHDQVGNRMLGERLAENVSFEALKLAAGVVLLSPFLPLLFMGEEYGETAPFQYFISHTDPDLVEAVRRGRKEEFASFSWRGEPPDPQDQATFERCRLNYELRRETPHRELLDFYTELIKVRKRLPALGSLSLDHIAVAGCQKPKVLFLRRWFAGSEVFVLFHFEKSNASVSIPLPAGRWSRVLDSSDPRWLGEGGKVPDEIESKGSAAVLIEPESFVLFSRLTGGRNP